MNTYTTPGLTAGDLRALLGDADPRTVLARTYLDLLGPVQALSAWYQPPQPIVMLRRPPGC